MSRQPAPVHLPHGPAPTSTAAALRRAALGTAEGHAEWVATHGPFSWDPYDYWAHPWGQHAKRIYYRHPRLGLPFAAPFVFLDTLAPSSRTLLRRRHRYPMADAHYAMGLCALARSGALKWRERALSFLEALVGECCPNEPDYCWGYPFDWVTCFGTWPSGTPLITSTPYGYEAFEAAHELTGSEECLRIMQSVGRFAFTRIAAVEVAPGVKASAYTPRDARRVTNASAYRGFLLAAAGARFQRADWTRESQASMGFVLQSQRPDGSWLYAMDGRDRFIDNLHTCFVLKNLVKFRAIVPDERVDDAVARGYEFYKTSLLDDRSLPIPFAKTQRTSLIVRDLYDYAEGINLALLMTGIDADARDIADALVGDLLDRWVLDDGHFVSRVTIAGRDTIPYVRWGQAQTFRALVLYSQTAEG
jgi:hypothetical protein